MQLPHPPTTVCLIHHHVSSHMNIWVYPLELSRPTLSQRAQACISWRLPRFGYFTAVFIITNLDDRFRSVQKIRLITPCLASRNLLNSLRGFLSSLLCFLTRRHVELGIVDPWQISFFAVTLEGSVALDCKSR